MGKPATSKKAASSKPAKGGVSKPVKAVEATKKVAKKAANAVSDAVTADKKKKKVPVKEESSSSSSESDSDSSSSDSSDSEVEEKKKPAAAAAKKETKSPKKVVKKEESSDSESSSSDSSDSESEDEKPKAKVNGAKKEAKKEESDSSSDSDSSDSDSDESMADAPAVKKEEPKKVTKKEESSDSSSDSDSDSEEASSDAKKEAATSSDSSDSDSSDSSDSESEKEDAKPKKDLKRKAEYVAENPVAKAQATEASGESSTCFVGGLSWNLDEDWIRSEFETEGFKPTGIRIITDRDSGKSKGFGYVEFDSPEAAKEAVSKMNGRDVDGRAWKVDISTPRPERQAPGERQKKYGDQRSPESATVFVANLAFDVDEDTLGAAFEKFGTITHIRVPTDRETGDRKGFAYVEFSSIDESKAAVDGMSGQSINGRAIRTDFSTPRDPNTSGGFGGGRGGGRGGRGGFGDRGGRGGGRGGRGGFGDRGGRGGRGGFGGRGGRGGSSGGNPGRGSIGEFKGKKVTFD